MKNHGIKCILGILFILFLTVRQCNSRAVVLNGGEVSLMGAVTDTQLDLKIDYTSNVKWILLIWGPDQVNTDAHLFLIDQNDAANPVKVKDCYINELSYINYDDVNNIQPSVTSYPGDISNGIKAAYNRDLNTGDSEDIRLYVNSVVQVCFISSTSAFQGKGYQKGQEKVCSFLSLHKATDGYDQDRLLGNYAGSTQFGGGNLTFYATKSTDGWTAQSWLFLSIVHKQQGLNPFSGKWLGITYLNSLTGIDLALISYETINFKLQVQIRDMYAQNSTYAKEDQKYVTLQGGNDIVKIYGAFDSTGYFVGSLKRKFSTGDVNRDSVLVSGVDEYCFIYGDSLVYSTFVQPQKVCLNFTMKSNYLSNFRVEAKSGTTGSSVIEYTAPKNKVTVNKKFEDWVLLGKITILLIGTIMMY